MFTAIAVTIVALGVGANITIFRLAHSLFLQLLPVRGAHRLVSVYETRDGRGFYPLSYTDYVDFRAGSTVFEDLVSHYSTAPINVVTKDRGDVLLGSVVSESYFSMLGLEPHLGRFFLPEENRTPGTHPVVVLSYRLWQRWFGGARDVIGEHMSLNGVSFEVVGIAPQDFHGVLVGHSNDLWIPSMMSSVGYRWCDSFSRSCTYLNVLGRLRPGRSIEEARTELELMARQLQEAYPDTHRNRGVSVVWARGTRPGSHEAVRLTTALGTVVAAVLLIACANLSGLFLARNASRRKEIALRLSLGASRSRIIRQLLTETVLVALLGGAASLLIASWMTGSLIPFYYFDRAWLTEGLEASIFLFSLGLSLAVGLAFGLWPALNATRLDVTATLKEETATYGRAHNRMRDILVVAQVAVSLALLIGTVLLLQSLGNVKGGSPFTPEGVLTLRLRPRLVGYNEASARAFHREVLERLDSTPGVAVAGLARGWPHSRYGDPLQVSRPGEDPAAEGHLAVLNDAVTPRYFETIQLPLLQGREFHEDDRRGSAPVVIVNRTLAARLWPNERPIGRRMVIDGSSYEVVGVVADALQPSMAEAPLPFFYRPYWQLSESLRDSRMCVRLEGDPSQLAGLVLREIAEVDSHVPVSEVSTLSEKLDDTVQPIELAASVTGAAGTVALLLTAVGLYGILALSVAQRVREIGIRMALGARVAQVVQLVVVGGVRWTALGVILGIPLAYSLSRLISSFLYGVELGDPWIYGGAAMLLSIVTLVASSSPARRAATIEPTTALRHE